MKILIAEQSKTMRRIIRNILKHMGHTDVFEAATGEEALKKVGEVKPDMILTGWHMPKMDGLTFVKSIRANNLDTPIMMVTSEAEKESVIEAISAGVSHYVIKPFDPETLTSRVNEMIDRHHVA